VTENIEDWANLIPDADPEDEEGWSSQGSVRVDGWWSHETMVPIRGELVQAVQMPAIGKDAGRIMVKIRLTHPTAARRAAIGDEPGGKIPEVFQPGALIGVTVRTFFESVLEYVETHGQVYLKALGKRAKRNNPGQSYWEFDFKVKGKQGPPPRLAEATEADHAAAAGDDIF